MRNIHKGEESVISYTARHVQHYRKALPNSIVLSEYLFLGNPSYDPEILKILHQVVCPYPPGTRVILSDGSEAIVLKVVVGNIAKPVIRILGTNERDEDLSQNSNLTIKAVC